MHRQCGNETHHMQLDRVYSYRAADTSVYLCRRLSRRQHLRAAPLIVPSLPWSSAQPWEVWQALLSHSFIKYTGQPGGGPPELMSLRSSAGCLGWGVWQLDSIHCIQVRCPAGQEKIDIQNRHELRGVLVMRSVWITY